jgi:hypothetical protein
MLEKYLTSRGTTAPEQIDPIVPIMIKRISNLVAKRNFQKKYKSSWLKLFKFCKLSLRFSQFTKSKKEAFFAGSLVSL